MYSLAPTFLCDSFFMFYTSLLNLFCSCIVSWLLLDCLSVVSCSSLGFLFTTILNSLLGNSCIPTSSGQLLYSLGGVMFPWVFVISIVLCSCLLIWRGSHLFQTLWVDFSKGWLLPVGGARWNMPCSESDGAGCQGQGRVATLERGGGGTGGSLTQSTGVCSINTFMVFGEHRRRFSEAARLWSVSAAPPGQPGR